MKRRLAIEDTGISTSDKIFIVLLPDCLDDMSADIACRGWQCRNFNTASSLALSISLHIVMLCILFYFFKSPARVQRNWIEVQLVSSGDSLEVTGSGEASTRQGSEQAGKIGTNEISAANQECSIPATSVEEVTSSKEPEASKTPEVQPPLASGFSMKSKPLPKNRGKEKIRPKDDAKTVFYNERPKADEPAPVASTSIAESSEPGHVTSAAGGTGPSLTASGSIGNGSGRGRPFETGIGSPGGPSFLHRTMPLYPLTARKQEREGTPLCV